MTRLLSHGYIFPRSVCDTVCVHQQYLLDLNNRNMNYQTIKFNSSAKSPCHGFKYTSFNAFGEFRYFCLKFGTSSINIHGEKCFQSCTLFGSFFNFHIVHCCSDGKGQILFAEFVTWALEKNLDIEEDID